MQSKLKPVVIFTTFWDAEYILNNKPDVIIYSIAITHPLIQKLLPLKKIDIFCPSYEMLKQYKEDKDWDIYTTKYRSLLRNKKNKIIEWINSLENDKVYILCCWENTEKTAKCHRQLLYQALVKSKLLKEKAVYVYRNGSKNEKLPSNNIWIQ